MSDYTKTTNFTVKDSLSPGDPNKIVKGAEIDTEFNNIETASASKLDNNVSATDKLLGRSSAGAGPVEEITCTDFAQSLLDDTSASTARTTLGLGTIATQNSSSVSITGGSITGVTDIAVEDGGTGSSTASGARTNLGLVIGTDVQAFDSNLSQLAGLAATNSNFIVGNGTSWVAESGATARASLGLGSLAIQSSVNNTDWSGTPLALANGGTGATTASAARTALGLGTIATVNSPVPIANGGTGATTANAALNALLPSQATHANKVLTTDGTNTSWTSKTASGLADPGSNGVVARTALDTTVARTITAGTNISVSNGDGVSGNPTVSFNGPTLNSGTYTPGVLNSTAGNSHFVQLGDLVIVYGTASKDSTSETVRISLPIASDFTLSDDLIGVILLPDGTTVGGLQASTTFNTATSNVSIPASSTFFWNFMYIIK